MRRVRPELKRALEREFASIAKMDAEEAAVATTSFITDLQDVLSRASDFRREAVTTLSRMGISHAEIGRRLGLTRARIQQIVMG